MAIEFFTGFEGCAETGDVAAFFDSFNDAGYTATGGYNGSKALSCGYTGHIAKNLLPAKTKTVGLHIAGDTDYSTSHHFLRFTLDDGSVISVRNTTAGLLVYYGSTLIASCTEYVNGNWNHIELKVFSNSTTGYVIFKINGIEVINETGLNTGGGDIVSFYKNWGGSLVIDNLYFADDFQGELYSYLLKPSSDVSAQFTPLSGTDNYTMLETDDGDTSYVASDTVGHKDIYGYEDIPEGLIPLSTTTVTHARKEGTGPRTFQAISKQDTTEYDDSDVITLGTTYPNAATDQAIVKVRSVAPDGTAWTREKINAMQFGFRVTG